MTDNVAELKAEIEKLREKNAQLLNEKKKTAGSKDELAAQLEAITQERDEAKAELHRLTVEAPRWETLEQVAMPNMADTLLREILHYFDIGEGEALISKETGEQFQITDPDQTGSEKAVPVKLDEDGIRMLYAHKVIPAVGAMIKGSGATGGGATGGRTPISTQPEPYNQKSTRRFGLS
ncbi:hypothetical protein [Marinobacter sp.]|uniref:hypothetical protein n=1 Tax=Marinobacter sp. TaxID=50741 RepID=UPI003A912293